MKNDTDIRKEAYLRIIKWELCWWLVAIAGGLLIAGAFSGSEIVNLFQHGFQGIRDCWVGIMYLLVAGYIVYSLLGILREKRKLIGHGIQAEAVVTAIQKETDAEKGKETLVAVYEFTLPGGKKRQIKEPIENSRAGHLGLIEVGSRVPIFVDRNNPDTFYLYIQSYPPILSGRQGIYRPHKEAQKARHGCEDHRASDAQASGQEATGAPQST